MKSQAIRLYETGGPEKMHWQDVELPALGPHDILLRQEASGVNFIDTYHRSGLYPLTLPSGLGVEGAGTIEAVGEQIHDLHPGQHIAYVSDIGSYAQWRILPAKSAIPLPAHVDCRRAAATLSKAMTVEYLIRRTYAVRPGDWVLCHAAAGGVGGLAAQWLRHLGAHIIGTVGAEYKKDIARKNGCHEVLSYQQPDWVHQVRDITKGQGVHVVYDGVGKDTFMASLDCLAPRGMMVTFGNASGAVPAIEPIILARKGSLFLTRPTLAHYIATRSDLWACAQAVFDMLEQGVLAPEAPTTYPMAQAAQAHRDLQDRKITGAAILLP